MRFAIDRATFNRRCQDIVQKSFVVCDEALKMARITAQAIDHVVLVGGTTLVPLVRDMVEQYFGKRAESHMGVHEVVAIGAAIYADNLNQQFYGRNVGGRTQPAALLIDVTPHSLGIETLGNIMDVIIERNTNIPAQRTRTFTTSSDNQPHVRIQIFEGEERTTLKNTKLGELSLSGLRAAPRGDVKIDVTFQINTDGMLEVMAIDRATRVSQACTLSIAGGLAPDEIKKLMSRRGQQSV
jgi:molecular chaperone DnaK